MEPAKLVAYGAIVLLIVLALSKLSRVLAPLLVIGYGLFIAPLVKSWYAFQDKYLMPAETFDTADDALCHDGNETTTDDTDRQTADRSPALSRTEQVLRLDRTRTGVVKALLLNGWTPTQIRPLLRGDNNTISQEIEQARTDLGGPDEPQFEQVGSRQQFVRTNAKPIR